MEKTLKEKIKEIVLCDCPDCVWDEQQSAKIHDLCELLKETCICAAVKDSTGYIWRGHRHGDCMVAALNAHRQPTGEQGFMTSENRFVGREEGRRLQDAAGIESAAADGDGYRGNTLFSEDLY